MTSLSQRPSSGARENRKQIFDAQYIAEWINASFPTLHVTADDIIRPTVIHLFRFSLVCCFNEIIKSDTEGERSMNICLRELRTVFSGR